MKTFKRPKTAQEAVLLEIRERLADGRLRPGQAIRPDVIGDELGVSSVPVREALRILEGAGQVRNRPHKGYLVTELKIEDLQEIHQVRQVLEAEAVRQALPRLQAEHIEAMREALQEMNSVEDDVIGMKAANRQFHFALFEAARMPHLLRLISWLWDSSEPYCSFYFMLPENRHRIDDEHERIVNAAVAGDVELTIKELDEHRKEAFAVLEQGILPIAEATAS